MTEFVREPEFGEASRPPQPPMVSVVVPVFNERDALPELYNRLTTVMDSVGLRFELIFVNDGSTDDSLECMLDLYRRDDNVRVLELSRNFGHQVAIAAGFDHARGDAVITMDGDLQHPPELIPKLIEKWQEGFEVVYTRRERSGGSGPFKDLTSRLFYVLVNRLSEVKVPAGAADFRLLDRSVVEVFRSLGERSLFLRGLVSWVGYQQAALSYDAPYRVRGKSKYSFLRMLRLAVDGLTSFSSVPLYVSAFLGIIVSAFSFVYAAYAIYARLFTDLVVEGWTSVLVMVLFLGGVNLIALGIHGLYLGRIFTEVKRRPRYLLRRTYGFDR